MTGRLLVMHPAPANPADFDRYYFEKHVPPAKKIPGLRKYDRCDETHINIDDDPVILNEINDNVRIIAAALAA